MDLIRRAVSLANDPRQTKWICPLLLLADAALCGLVVWKIPYTEIDWKAYMQQVSQYTSGERDYTKLYGDTGPLVYPAAHVYIYHLLYKLTDQGRDIALAQYIFIGVYLTTLTVVMQCYRKARVPPWVFSLLLLSKRLHSVFLLRLFNDCFAVLFLWVAVWCWQRSMWTVGSVVFSVGLGIKMTVLLALPAVGVVLWQGAGRTWALNQAMLMGQVQIILGLPFLAQHPRSYLTRAFEFTRQFMFKWTVNWRFIGEEMFLSRPFSIALLAIHAALLTLFISTRWLRPAGVGVPQAIRQLIKPPPSQQQAQTSRRVTPDFIMTAVLTCMTVGCLCARSLHYQFFAYIAWTTPFLLWRSGLHPVGVYAVWLAQEWAWNVYPSTNTSSMVVVGCLAVTVLGSWWGTGSSGTDLADSRTNHPHKE